MDLKCKNENNIFWLLWGKPGDTIYTNSRFLGQNNQDSKYFDKKRLVDMRQFNCKYYTGYSQNNHHILTSSYYRIIIPYLSLLIGFNFDINDFNVIPYLTSGPGMVFDCSYLWPKTDFKFTLSIGGENVCTNENFECLTNATDKWKKKYGCVNTEYHKIFRGTHESSMIINETINNNKSICISGDSYCIPIIPILACYFKEVVFLDKRIDGKKNNSPRQYYENKVFDYVIISCWEQTSIMKYIKDNFN